MKISYKYRIYPTESQQEILQKVFNFCRFLYNSALEERNSYYKKYRKGISYLKQAAYLSEIKEEFKEQVKGSIYSQCLQSTLKQLNNAFDNFFRRVKQKLGKAGYPRFKSFDRYNSIRFPQSDFTCNGVKLTADTKHIEIFGIPGKINIEYHRPYEGICKTVVIKKHADKYYVVLSCIDVPIKPLPKTGKTISIDLGITKFIKTNENDVYYHPKPYRTAKEKLSYLNRKLASKQKGSNNRKKLKIKLARAHEKVANIRLDFQHKTANDLLKKYDKIILEDLNLISMLKSEEHIVKKANILDAAFGQFVSILTYKAERADKLLKFVSPVNTSKRCSKCGELKKDLTLHDRTYHCEYCGLEIDRDLNAALNILELGTSLDNFRSPTL